MPRDKDSITLGSGKQYIKEFTGSVPKTSAEILALIKETRTEANRIGYISGGASIETTAEWYSATDDLGYVKKTILTAESATLKTGIMTFNAASLQTLSSTTRIDELDGTKIVKIGGVGNQDGKMYFILFYHEDKDEGDIAVFIIGKNQTGFTLAFAKDKETIIDAQFSAFPMDDEGTLVGYVEYDVSADVAATIPHTLTIAAGVGGSITTGASGEHAPGEVIPLEAAPDGGSTFAGWASVGGGTFDDATAESANFTMPGNDATVLASFTPDGATVPHTLTIAAGVGGSITTGASGEHAPGEVIPLEAAPDGGSTFAGWTSTGGGTFDDPAAESTNFTMPGSDTVVLANFTTP